MGEPIDIVKLVKALPSRPRGRACIVFTHDYSGQKGWASELARQTGYDHINLLEHFAKEPKLSDAVEQFSVPRLFDFLKGYSTADLLIVSGMEFLKATWAGQPYAGEQFASRVETWSEKPCLLFVMQYDKSLASRKFRRFPQYTFIVDQKETLAL
ncbi:MAG: hypothetical protein ACOX33_06850 [Dethiobacteria bacterium]|jgi:hypothetical protein